MLGFEFWKEEYLNQRTGRMATRPAYKSLLTNGNEEPQSWLRGFKLYKDSNSIWRLDEEWVSKKIFSFGNGGSNRTWGYTKADEIYFQTVISILKTGGFDENKIKRGEQFFKEIFGYEMLKIGNIQ